MTNLTNHGVWPRPLIAALGTIVAFAVPGAVLSFVLDPGVFFLAIIISFILAIWPTIPFAEELDRKKQSAVRIFVLVIARWVFCLVGGVIIGGLLNYISLFLLSNVAAASDLLPDTRFVIGNVFLTFVVPILMIIAAIFSWRGFGHVSDKLIEKWN